MKRFFAFSLAAMLCGSVAYAQTNNTANITQVGDISGSNYAEITQQGGGNSATITSYGDGNGSSSAALSPVKIEQTTANNIATINQGESGTFSDNNAAQITQGGVNGDNDALITQKVGDGNKATIQQDTDGNGFSSGGTPVSVDGPAIIHQDGGSNDASIHQYGGDGNSAKISSYGDNNGTIAPVSIDQNGAGNHGEITQGVSGTPSDDNEASISQTGSANSATISQED